MPKAQIPSEPRRVLILDPLVAERIAAGEVIERPSSVVKELVENSLDAGATEVSVQLEDGGKSLIEVSDNGHGIHRDDLRVCIERHATSKLRSLEDLERISTLGFRGEALPSVGAVSDLSILSRARGSDTAYEMNLSSLKADPKPEAVTFGHFQGSSHGTRIQARGLFSQIPARLKFLKSQAAEVSQVREWLERLALAHPATGFRLISDSRQVLNLRPQDEVARVKAILSDGEDYPVVSVQSEGALRIRAHWIQGLSSPQTRKIVQVVNGRSVRDRFLQQAILSAFRQSLLPGQFPAIAVFIEIDPASIDVNVHPTKTEIRFLENRTVFREVDSLLSSMIEKNGAPAVVPASVSAPLWSASEPAAPSPGHSWTGGERRQPLAYTEPFRFDQPATAELTHEQTAPQTDSPAPRANPLGLTFDRFVGLAFQTYLFYDLGHELVLIDQHAAHERIRYEKLKARALNAKDGTVQALLIPEAVRFEAEKRPLMEERLGLLLRLGFEAEIFGEDTLLFRSVPGEWGVFDQRTRLKNLVDRVLHLELGRDFSPSTVLLDETLFEKLASEACHSAVRAGDRLERVEALELVDQLFRCEHPWNCPHGRPTVARIPKGKIEEWFQRRV